VHLLSNGVTTLAHLSGRMREAHVRVVAGDVVRVAFSPYDLTRGRIIYRHTPGLKRAA